MSCCSPFCARQRRPPAFSPTSGSASSSRTAKCESPSIHPSSINGFIQRVLAGQRVQERGGYRLLSGRRAEVQHLGDERRGGREVRSVRSRPLLASFSGTLEIGGCSGRLNLVDTADSSPQVQYNCEFILFCPSPRISSVNGTSGPWTGTADLRGVAINGKGIHCSPLFTNADGGKQKTSIGFEMKSAAPGFTFSFVSVFLPFHAPTFLFRRPLWRSRKPTTRRKRASPTGSSGCCCSAASSCECTFVQLFPSFFLTSRRHRRRHPRSALVAEEESGRREERQWRHNDCDPSPEHARRPARARSRRIQCSECSRSPLQSSAPCSSNGPLDGSLDLQMNEQVVI